MAACLTRVVALGATCVVGRGRRVGRRGGDGHTGQRI